AADHVREAVGVPPDPIAIDEIAVGVFELDPAVPIPLAAVPFHGVADDGVPVRVLEVDAIAPVVAHRITLHRVLAGIAVHRDSVLALLDDQAGRTNGPGAPGSPIRPSPSRSFPCLPCAASSTATTIVPPETIGSNRLPVPSPRFRPRSISTGPPGACGRKTCRKLSSVSPSWFRSTAGNVGGDPGSDRTHGTMRSDGGLPARPSAPPSWQTKRGPTSS